MAPKVDNTVIKGSAPALPEVSEERGGLLASIRAFNAKKLKKVKD